MAFIVEVCRVASTAFLIAWLLTFLESRRPSLLLPLLAFITSLVGAIIKYIL